ncbi:hypothetical protein C5167_022163 [Papaver somniferum]|uniref:GB1/RHD3-type G domain-containing protein n=1 Tax=Papaver somniferum TaxID=3469 RepID=A0A4Y7JI27_PAPSO|nr:hypothetical protein C5167_022163 [Papaver somniferum]
MGGGEEADKEECSTQLIDGNGVFNATGFENFMETVNISECGVVAIMGPQSSGKSTLLNYLFHTNFKEMDAFKGRWVLSCNDRQFEKQSARFALAVSDIVLINMWCHDIGRNLVANMPYLKTVFKVIMSSQRKVTLLFVVRDKTKTPFEHLELVLKEDIQKIWDGVPKSEADKDTPPLSEFCNFEVVALSSCEEKEEQFKEEVKQLKNRIILSIAPRRWDRVSASTFCCSTLPMLWENIRDYKDIDPIAHEVVVAAFKCQEIANEKLRHFTSNEDWLVLDEAVEAGFVSGFGEKVSSILDAYLSEYDSEAIVFDESVRNLKREKLELKALQFVHPTYQTLLRHLQAKCLDNFNKALKQSVEKGEGFVAAVRSCLESSVREFDEGLVDWDASKVNKTQTGMLLDACVKIPDWDASKVKVKLLRDITDQAESICCAKLSELNSYYENQLTEALSEPVKCLLESAGDNTWALIRKLVQREKEAALSKFTNALNILAFSQEKVDLLVQDRRDFANTVVEERAREEVSKVLTRMKNRFSAVFNYDGNSIRIWTGEEDIVSITMVALSATLRLLSVMSAIRLDEKPDRISNQLLSFILDRRVAHFDPLATSSWDEIPAEDTLITPVQCKSLWRKFMSETKSVVTPVISAQEAHRRHRRSSFNWITHLWVIPVMVILGSNEFMLLLKSPLYFLLLFVGYLVGKFCNRPVSVLVSVWRRFFWRTSVST